MLSSHNDPNSPELDDYVDIKRVYHVAINLLIYLIKHVK